MSHVSLVVRSLGEAELEQNWMWIVGRERVNLKLLRIMNSGHQFFVFNRFTFGISSAVRSAESDRVNILGDTFVLVMIKKHMSESIQSNTLQHQLLRQIESPAASARPSGRPNRVESGESE